MMMVVMTAKESGCFLGNHKNALDSFLRPKDGEEEEYNNNSFFTLFFRLQRKEQDNE